LGVQPLKGPFLTVSGSGSDGKRSQNIAIVCSSIKVEAAELRTALLQADTSVVTPEVVERLLTMCPITEEEVGKCKGFEGGFRPGVP
jgi:hypothetical protein